MKISLNLARYNTNTFMPNFRGINTPSKKDEADNNIFFVNMNNYGKNTLWAAKMGLLLSDISNSISQNEDFDYILEQTENGINDINGYVYGKRRTIPEFFCIKNENQRGGEYYKRYIDKIKNSPSQIYSAKSNNEFKDANTSQIYLAQDNSTIKIDYGFTPIGLNSNLEFAAQAYDNLKKIKSPSIDDINKSCAEIYWLIAQGAPYCKGNDSIASILTKGIYHSYNIPLKPLKQGLSLDFEAFDTNLDEYIKNYPNFFN